MNVVGTPGVPSLSLKDPEFDYTPAIDTDVSRRFLPDKATRDPEVSSLKQLLSRVAAGTSTTKDAVRLAKRLGIVWNPR
jgi:hypothetical protein